MSGQAKNVRFGVLGNGLERQRLSLFAFSFCLSIGHVRAYDKRLSADRDLARDVGMCLSDLLEMREECRVFPFLSLFRFLSREKLQEFCPPHVTPYVQYRSFEVFLKVRQDKVLPCLLLLFLLLSLSQLASHNTGVCTPEDVPRHACRSVCCRRRGGM